MRDAGLPSFKEQMLAAREEAIIRNVSRLLSEKGFDAMTVDEVASSVGIAKASLYKHFTSKEELAASAMLRLVRRAAHMLDGIDPQVPEADRLRAAVRWILQVRIAGQMPALPSQNSSLRAVLVRNREYGDAVAQIGARLLAWIEAAQRAGTIDPSLPAQAVLHALYAQAANPLLDFLRASGRWSDEQATELVLRTCFGGLQPSTLKSPEPAA